MVTPSHKLSAEVPLDLTGNVVSHLIRELQKRSASDSMATETFAIMRINTSGTKQ